MLRLGSPCAPGSVYITGSTFQNLINTVLVIGSIKVLYSSPIILLDNVCRLDPRQLAALVNLAVAHKRYDVARLLDLTSHKLKYGITTIQMFSPSLF
ncbi:hypothetical protein L873DRAFT_1080071 [Choiromyces venosus 120613-1]|uniref:Uncharacterized protein n=1 Tax=Choiromyces venosus 120613-1 TaxID=1336337 RepID=A0A3N4JIB2_9PEZI|nr:hypothetical protein L873DRAFT_1080071 [Choiromyces venosus 120613-1]